MEALILLLILGDPMPPNINNLMVFLNNFIELFPLVYHLLLLIRLLHSCNHPLFFLLLLAFFYVCNCDEATSWGCILADPSLHLCDGVVNKQGLWLIVEFFLCLRLLHGLSLLAFIEFWHYHQIFELDPRILLGLGLFELALFLGGGLLARPLVWRKLAGSHVTRSIDGGYCSIFCGFIVLGGGSITAIDRPRHDATVLLVELGYFRVDFDGISKCSLPHLSLQKVNLFKQFLAFALLNAQDLPGLL